jgi:formylglycine-generating enzyme required for sulfatase activity
MVRSILLGSLCVAAVLFCRRDSPPEQAGRADPFDGSRAGDERVVAGVKLCWCPPGRFRMGSPPAELERRPDEEQVEVTLTRGFWAGKYEVTQGQ